MISDAAGEARKTIAPVTSSMRPMRPMGIAIERPGAKFGILEKHGGHRRFEERGTDGVHPNILRRELHGHRFVQPLDGVLGHAIDRAARRADVPHLRRDMDDRAAFFAAVRRFEHFAHRRLCDQERGAHVERQHLIEVIFGNVDERFGNVHARVVDENVEPLEPPDFGANASTVVHVADDWRGARASLSDALRYRFEIAAGSAEENQFGAGARKRDRRLRADAAARAGDQREAAVEPEGGQDCGCS